MAQGFRPRSLEADLPHTPTFDHAAAKTTDRADDGRPGGRRAGDHRRRLGRDRAARVVSAPGRGTSRDPPPGGPALENRSDGRRDRITRSGRAGSPRDSVHRLRVGRDARRAAGDPGRPGRSGGLRGRGRRRPPGPGPKGRRDHHRAVEQGGLEPGRARLPGTHRAAGRDVRHRRLRYDALPGPGRPAPLAHGAGRGSRHLAHGLKEGLWRVDRGGRPGQGPASWPA